MKKLSKKLTTFETKALVLVSNTVSWFRLKHRYHIIGITIQVFSDNLAKSIKNLKILQKRGENV